MSETPAHVPVEEPVPAPEAVQVEPTQTETEKDAEIARLRRENASLAKGDEATNERPLVQHGTDLVQEQADGSRAVVGTASPE